MQLAQAAAAHSLGDQGALVLGHRAADLQQQLVVWILAHRPVEELDHCAVSLQLFDQQYLVHVHISENDRSTPGQGNVRWAENFDTLKEIGYNGWLVVEAFGLALPALVAATKIWRRMYQSEEQLARDALAFMKREWSSRL